MKKQNQTNQRPGTKLSLNKKTISNLTTAEMNQQVGGDRTKGRTCAFTCDRTCWGRTCNLCWY